MATAESARPSPSPSLFGGSRGRRAREALTAYVFVFPAFLIIGVFGLFPIAFAFYVSLHRWRIKQGEFFGLGNYTRALDTLAYVMAFWIAIICAILGAVILIRAWRSARENHDKAWVWLLPGAVTAVGVAAFGRFAVLLLPEVLNIGEKAKGQERTQELFLQLLGEAWSTPSVQTALRQSLFILAAGFVLAYLVHRFLSRSAHDVSYYGSFVVLLLLLLGAGLLGWFTWTEIEAAYSEALESGESLELWSQIVTTFAFGGDVLSEDGTGYVYNGPATVESMTFIKQLYDDGCAYFFTEGYPNPEFAARRAIFTQGSSSGLPFYAGDIATVAEEEGREPDEWGFTAIPHTTPDPVVDVYGGDVMIPATTPETQLAAWYFIKWYTSPEVQADWVRASNYFPTRSATSEFLGDYISENPQWGAALELLQYGKFEPQLISYQGVRDAAAQAFNEIMQGADIQTTLDNLTEEANELQAELME